MHRLAWFLTGRGSLSALTFFSHVCVVCLLGILHAWPNLFLTTVKRGEQGHHLSGVTRETRNGTIMCPPTHALVGGRGWPQTQVLRPHTLGASHCGLVTCCFISGKDSIGPLWFPLDVL